MDLETIAPIIGALGLGSVVTQVMLGGKSRREVRSAVLAQLAKTENARWGGSNAVSFSEFLDEIRALETASLISRIPRKAVLNYVVLAHAGRIRSQELLDEYGGPEDDEDGHVSGWLHNELGGLVRKSAWIMTNLVWSPWLARITLWLHLVKLRDQIKKLDEHERELVRAGERIHGGLAE